MAQTTRAAKTPPHEPMNWQMQSVYDMHVWRGENSSTIAWASKVHTTGKWRAIAYQKQPNGNHGDCVYRRDVCSSLQEAMIRIQGSSIISQWVANEIPNQSVDDYFIEVGKVFE